MDVLLDVRRMQLLAQVVRDRSFSKAAETLGHLPAGVVEEHPGPGAGAGGATAGEGTLRRAAHPFARSLVRHADAIDAELRSAHAQILAMRSAKAGALHVGCGPTEATRLLPVALAGLRKDSPGSGSWCPMD